MCSSTSTSGKVRLVYLILLCVMQFSLGIFYLGSVPRIFMDEAWDASLGYELAKTGVLRHPFIHAFGGMEVYYIQPRVLLPSICAVVFKIMGYSIAVSRLPSLLMGVLAIAALYHIAEKFFDNKQSFFICLVTIISPWFWMNCRRCRPEIYCTALALLFLWLVILYFRKDGAWLAFLAGMTAALVSLTHPNGLLIIIAVSISWIIWQRKPHLLRFIIWSLSAFILTVLPYVIYAFWADRHPDVSFHRQIKVDLLYGSIMTKEIMRWRSFLQLPFGIPVALLMFAGWLAAWWKSTAEDKLAATVVVIYPVGLVLGSVNALPDYLVAVVPFFNILIIRFVFRLEEFSFLGCAKKICFFIRLCVILVFMVFSMLPIIFMLYQQHNADFNKVVDEVAAVVGAKARVYGDPVFWVGHDRYIYGPHLIAYDAVTCGEALSWAYSNSFDYAVRTPWVSSPPRGFKKLPDRMPDFRSYVFADILCKMFGTRVHRFYNEYYGTIEIYKLDWSRAPQLGLKKQPVR